MSSAASTGPVVPVHMVGADEIGFVLSSTVEIGGRLENWVRFVRGSRG